MSSSDAHDLVARWVTPKEAADGMPAAARVTVQTIYEWCRAGLVHHRRSPGHRGRFSVAVDRDGFPIATRVMLTKLASGNGR